MPRVHRLGRFNRGNTRPIIANCLDTRDTDRILSNAYKLKNTPYSINRDYPKEIADARKVLWPEVKRMRQHNPEVKINIVYLARIVKDGKVVADMFPNWNKIMHRDRITATQTCRTSLSRQPPKQPNDATYPPQTLSNEEPAQYPNTSRSPTPASRHVPRMQSVSPNRARNQRSRPPVRERGNAAPGADQFNRPLDSPVLTTEHVSSARKETMTTTPRKTLSAANNCLTSDVTRGIYRSTPSDRRSASCTRLSVNFTQSTNSSHGCPSPAPDISAPPLHPPTSGTGHPPPT